MGKKAAIAAKKRRDYKLRKWRKKTGRSLTDVAAEIEMSHATLSRIERDDPEQGFTRDLLEKLVKVYGADHPVDLLIRDPDDPEGFWSVWDRASPSQRKKIVDIARTIVAED